MKTDLGLAPRNPAMTPLRRPDSIRRTTTMVADLVGGPRDPMSLRGRGRDAQTSVAGALDIVDAADLVVEIAADRTIVVADSPGIDLSPLHGLRSGSGFRAALEIDSTVVPSLLHLLLDDLPGVTLIAPFGLSQHPGEWPLVPVEYRPAMDERMRDVCVGHATGSSALGPTWAPQSTAPAPAIVNSEDLDGWHELPTPPSRGMRRARRLDVWRDGVGFVVDAMFRDTTWSLAGEEIAVHEYEVHATVDADNLLTGLETIPRVLPYPECPGAVSHANRIVGLTLSSGQMPNEVKERLAGVRGCTHLTDALRGLADVPTLASHLPR